MKTITNTDFKQTEIGQIPEDWQIVRLADASSKIGSGITPRGAEKVYKESGVPLIRSQNVYNNSFNKEGLVYLDEITAREMENVALEKDDVLLNITGDSVARCTTVPEEVLPARVSQHVCIIRMKGDHLNPIFLRYYLTSPRMQTLMLSLAQSGGTRNALTKGMIERFLIPKPKLNEQASIAKILADIDSKITICQRMNKTLEAIGKAIFKHWFIDFEFPNEGGKPHKSSGGEMIYNEELQEEIPKTWQVVPLDVVAEFVRGFSYRGSEKTLSGGEYVFVTLNSVKEGGGFKREFSYITSNRLKERHFVYRGQIVIANTEQTKTGTLLGCPALVEFPRGYEKGKAVISHHITKVVPRQTNLNYFLYYLLLFRQPDAVKYNTGSVIWALDVNNWAKNEKVVVPHGDVRQTFEALMQNVFLRSLEDNLQSETLSSLRDSLLPKLMSGKIRVPLEAK